MPSYLPTKLRKYVRKCKLGGWCCEHFSSSCLFHTNIVSKIKLPEVYLFFVL